jgi:hypothetical protein
MRIQFPLNFSKEEDVYTNNQTFPGGFFPVGENNFWHGGVHLRGEGPVKPIADGEIIGCRISETYSSAPLPEILEEERVNGLSVSQMQKITEAYDYNEEEHNYCLKGEVSEKALVLATKLGEYGAPCILFNCKYVVDKCTTSRVIAYPGHHHHFHVYTYNSSTGHRSDSLCTGCEVFDDCDYIN